MTNASKGLKLFSGKDPTLVESWYEKTGIMLSSPDIHNVIEEQIKIRPTEETSADEAPLADARLRTIELNSSCLVRTHRKGTWTTN